MEGDKDQAPQPSNTEPSEESPEERMFKSVCTDPIMKELHTVCTTKGGTVSQALLQQVIHRVFQGTQAIHLNEQTTREKHTQELAELEGVDPAFITSLNLNAEQLLGTLKVKMACAAAAGKKQPSGKVGAPQPQSSAKRPAQEPKKPEPVSDEDDRYNFFKRLMSASDVNEGGWPGPKN